MKCIELDRILDDQELAGLSRTDRAAVDEHLRGCPRCASVWQAHESLAAEPLVVPAEAFERMLARLDRPAVPSAREATLRRGPFRRFALPFGLAAVAVLGLFVFLQPEGDSRIGREPEFAARPAPQSRPGSAAVELLPRFVEGREYTRLAATAAPTDGFVVQEFFMYGCPHCYAFEGLFDPWTESRPDGVRIVRVPVVFNAVAGLHARAHYAAEVLGIGDRFRAALYTAIHARHEVMATAADLASLAAQVGADADAFEAALGSPAVLDRVRRAEQIAKGYGIRATPSLVVDGEFLIMPGTAGSYEDMLEVAEQLIEDAGAGQPVVDQDCAGTQPKCPLADRSRSSAR